ncbi:MAG TPA: hypothetical protein VGR37_19635 [Longimicrobiaceae bacterium]|nr:hypothetical protein [Longimicrobiaceae bacterium]
MPFRPSDGDLDPPSGLAAVTIRAACDREFRSSLLMDPHLAIRESFGIVLPPTLRLRFVEKPGDVDLLVVLPDLLDQGPLPLGELERVPGGAGSIHCCIQQWSDGVVPVQS